MSSRQVIKEIDAGHLIHATDEELQELIQGKIREFKHKKCKGCKEDWPCTAIRNARALPQSVTKGGRDV